MCMHKNYFIDQGVCDVDQNRNYFFTVTNVDNSQSKHILYNIHHRIE